MRKLYIASISFILLFWQMSVSAETIYTIARAPQQSAFIIEKAWAPYIDYLNKNTHYKFKLKVYNSRELFEADIKSGQLDFYCGNPGYGIVGKLNHSYQPIVRSNKKMLQGIIVTKSSNPIKDIKHLQGETLVFPGKTAFAASLLVQYYLEKDHGVTVSGGYVEGHDNVYRNVLTDNYIAGGGVPRTLGREDKSFQEKLKIIYKTPEIYPHLLMANKDIPNEVIKAVQNKTFLLHATSEGREVLTNIKIRQPVKPNYNEEYKPLEDLVSQVYGYMLIN